MSAIVFGIKLVGPDATQALAEQIGHRLEPGDTLLLSGDIGAGKTHFARALIQSLQDTPEDVPSPTFTLVQSYETSAGEILHADLYRLSGPQDIEELGLSDAFGRAICLVEWPDRLGPDAPADALMLHLEASADGTSRMLTARSDSADWPRRLKGVCDD